MNIKYIHHSCFLVETGRFYYLFDYEKGDLPKMNLEKPIYVLSSHSHDDHYNEEIFVLLKDLGMEYIQSIISEDIDIPANVDTLQVSPNKTYDLGLNLQLTTFKSTDLGVAFLIEDEDMLIYHAGDLNDWVWDDESDDYNKQMTLDYRHEINILSDQINNREIDVAFVVLDPRQELDYARGLCYFLETIPSKQVYPMHYWDKPSIIEKFLNEYPQYQHQINIGE